MSTYNLGDLATDLEPGTNVLVTGSREDASRFAYETLKSGLERGDAAVVVATDEDAKAVEKQLVATNDDVVGIVDCVGSPGTPVTENTRVKHPAGPTDLTGVGIELSELLEDVHELQQLDSRVLLDTVSTILADQELETVFRFLHVFTQRVESADGLGLYVLDPEEHGDQTIETVRQLFDHEVTVDGEEATVSALES